MSRAVLRGVYAPPLLSALPERFGGVLRQRLERGFARHPNVENPVRGGAAAGSEESTAAGTGADHPVRCGDAASWLQSSPAASFDAFTLSNILDGASLTYREQLSRAVRHAAAEGAVVVLRSFAEPDGSSRNHAELDRSMLWGIVDVRCADTW